MINGPVLVLVLGVVVGLAGLLIALESYTGWKVFKYVPAFVLMYLGCAALNTFGILGDAEGSRDALKATKDLLLPAMIFVLLLGCDLRRIAQLGPKLLLTFFVTVLSIMAAFIGVFALFRAILSTDVLSAEAWIPMASLLGSWTGGSANMVAVNEILEGPENLFGFAVITDTVVYSAWLILMFSSVAVASRFDRWTKADSTRLEEHMERVTVDEAPITRASLAVNVFTSLLIGAVALRFGTWMAKDLGAWAAVSTPIMADEALWSSEDARRLIDAGAADLFNIKLAKTGGLEDAVRIADLAAEHGIGCMVGSMMEPRISIGAAVHLSLAHPAVTMVDLDAPLWFDSTAPEGGFEQAGGTVRLTGGAGLGLRRLDARVDTA